MIRLVALCLLLLIIGVGSVRAQARWALVVGMGHYATLPALPSAESDARAMADILERAGFSVTLLIDPTISVLRHAVAVAQTAAAGAPAAVFYYAGHAVQFRGRNLLLGADARIADVKELIAQGLDLSDVVQRMAPAALRLILVDACRDNPLAFTMGVETSQGLAQMPAGAGTTIVFAAASGHRALDGNEGHSPFAAALLRHMLKPGVELSEMIRLVAKDVSTQTDGAQEVEPRDNHRDDFYLVPLSTTALGPSPPPARSRQGVGVDVLLARLQPDTGIRRLYGLEDSLRVVHLERGLDAGQALALMGDIPAPALRRRALSLLMPSLLAPIGEPETVRLLEGFDQAARGTAIEMLLPCLALPMTTAEAERVLADTPPPLRGPLGKALQRSADRASCPALGT